MNPLNSNQIDGPGGYFDEDRGLVLDEPTSGRLAKALAAQFTLNYETHPSHPRVSAGGRLLSFSFDDGLTASERSRLAAGRGEEVREFRERVLHAAGEEMAEVVEALLPALEVSHFFAAFDADSLVTNCFFVLDWRSDTVHEQREALRAWSEQVRRHARRLRARSSHTREANAPLLRGFAELRRNSHWG